MTLSLDDVRNKRFRLARKSGYEVAEVDDFLDQLQESFGQLIEENDNLKKQIDALAGDRAHEIAGSPAIADSGRREHARPEPAERETVVVTASGEASAAVVRLVQMSTEQAERLVAEATAEAERIRSEADEAAQRLTSDTRSEAERMSAEARERAERLRADAQVRAQQLDTETAERRRQLFGALEQERTALAGAIEDLRDFEQSFRVNLTEHLRRHIKVLESGRAEPGDLPDLAAPVAVNTTAHAEHSDAEHSAAEPSADGLVDDGQVDDGQVDDDSVETDPDATVQVSDTPRLDALLGDQR